jgi:hypothetical protein
VATSIVLLAIVTMQAPSAGTTPRAAVQSAPAQTPAPADWTGARKTMVSLLGDQKCPEAIALGEQWVAKQPSSAEAHLWLGSAYENTARGFCGRPRDPLAIRTKQLETAAMHMRRGFELGGGESPRITIRGLVDLYGLLALDRPDEQEKIAREAVVRFPTEPVAHAELISSLLRRGAEAEAAKAVAAARAALPKRAQPRFELASTLAFRAMGDDPVFKATYTRETRAAMGRIALGMLDDVLAIRPEHNEARREKVELERALAELPNELPLSASRLPANGVIARGTLRAIMSAQTTYSSMCGAGFYAPTLAALAKPRAGEKFGFFYASDVPPGGDGVLKENGYAIEMTAPPSPKSPAGCNGVPAGQSAETWSATARPQPGYVGRSYRIDAEGALTEIK